MKPGKFLSLAALSMACGPSYAAWEVVPELSVTTEVDDNARIVSEEQPSSTRTALDARLRLRSFGDRGEAYIEPRVVVDKYHDERDQPLENNDVFLRARAVRELPRANFEFRSDFRRESVLRSEIDNSLLDEPVIGSDPIDTGGGTLGDFSDERERIDLGLAGDMLLSQRTRFGLEASLIDAAYANPQDSGRTDYSANTLAAVLTRLVDDRNEVSARVYTTTFEAERNDNETDTLGVEATFLRPVNQQVSVELDFGVARSEFSYLDAAMEPVEGVNNLFTFGFSVEKRSELTRWTVGATRSVSPNSIGFLDKRNDFRLQVRHRLSQRVNMSAGLRAVRIQPAEDVADRGEQDYIRASIEFQWDMARRLQFLAGLDHVTEEIVGGFAADASSNTVFVGLRYQGLQRN